MSQNINLTHAAAEDLEKIISLRQDVLHPDGPRERVLYSQDSLPSTVHLIYKTPEQEVLAVGTLVKESEDGCMSDDVPADFRIRGMAVQESLRGQGIGSKILDEFIKIALEKSAPQIWCNARLHVLPLYERKGFVKKGDPFDVPGSGPHYRMNLTF